MSQDTEILDIDKNAKPIFKGFAVALRDRETFHFLNDIFNAMNLVQKGLESKLNRNQPIFLIQNYGQQVALLWEAIEQQYKKFGASVGPVRQGPPESFREDEILSYYGAIDRDDTESLRARFQALFPRGTQSRHEAVTGSFINFFEKTSRRSLKVDRQLCVEELQRVCLHLASLKTVADNELRGKDPKEAHDNFVRRQTTISSLFSRASTDFVSAASATMKTLLLSATSNKRVQFFDGGRGNSLDGELGGFHGSGLVCFIGGTSGFKTGNMSSIVANHVIRYLDGMEDQPAEIWCYIGEDGEDSYPRRILVNLINRLAAKNEAIAGLLKSFNRDLTLGTFKYFIENQDFVELVEDLLSGAMRNLHFIRAPETPEEMASFSIINILNAFDAKIASENKKPRFIIIDYLNLLRLPRSYSFNNRAEEISSISHILDEWGNMHRIPIITAAQASAEGNIKSREMEFYNQEHIHECRSVQHHARMMVSILTYDDPLTKDAGGRSIDRMALKILKNRDGKKGDIFRVKLDFAKNISMVDSERVSEEDWLTHRREILEKKASIVEGVEHAGGSRHRGASVGGRHQAGGGFKAQAGGPHIRPTQPPRSPIPRPQASETATPSKPVASTGTAVDKSEADMSVEKTSSTARDDSHIFFDEWTNEE